GEPVLDDHPAGDQLHGRISNGRADAPVRWTLRLSQWKNGHTKGPPAARPRMVAVGGRRKASGRRGTAMWRVLRLIPVAALIVASCGGTVQSGPSPTVAPATA